jgi:phosphatidylethanolamine/phosphatidyl-N-methylethanolamine N-methyltransferase
MEKREFIKQFWKNKKSIGAMRPSSRILTDKMLQNIPFKRTKVFVELGPGTGVFTKEILSQMSDDSLLFVFEVNDEFFSNLQKKLKDKRCILIHDTAENISVHLNERGIEKADVIVSSLPLANFEEGLRTDILKTAYENLQENGKFIQYQYSLQAKNILTDIFSQVNIDFTLWNLPPAFIYTCCK